MKRDLTVAGYIFRSGPELLLVYHRGLGLWLPVGGHIEPNEAPDDAMVREAKQEVNLDINFLRQSHIPLIGNVIRNLALPFYSNVHSVGDHEHIGLFYLCKALNPDELKINEREISMATWFTRRGLSKNEISPEIRVVGESAFNHYLFS